MGGHDMTSPEMRSGEVDQSSQAMNWEFEAWQEATKFIRQARPILEQCKPKRPEGVLIFMAQIVEWMFDHFYGINNVLVQFTMGQNRVFLQGKDAEGKKYQISVKR